MQSWCAGPCDKVLNNQIFFPATAADVTTCTNGVEVLNTGNVRLTDINITGDTSCARAGPLLPNAKFECDLVKATTQDDFENAKITLSVSATASPMGVNSSLAGLAPSHSVDRQITQIPSVQLVAAPDQTSVDAAGMYQAAE